MLKHMPHGSQDKKSTQQQQTKVQIADWTLMHKMMILDCIWKQTGRKNILPDVWTRGCHAVSLIIQLIGKRFVIFSDQVLVLACWLLPL